MALNRNDLYVVVPGILGSTLARRGKPVWSPSPAGVLETIKTFGKCIRGLKLPPGLGDAEPGDEVVATGLFPDIHIIPGLWSFGLGYGELETFLRKTLLLTDVERHDGPANLLLFAYDWRLSNRVNGRRLAREIEAPLRTLRRAEPSAKVNLICHSMGGLVARWYIAYEGGGDDVRRLITVGTPHRGALEALDQLVNGPTRRWLGITIRLQGLAPFIRSLPSMHQLLPEYACVESDAGLKKLTEISVPGLDGPMLEDGMKFHEQLDASPPGGRKLRFYPIAGTRQRTSTTAILNGRTVRASPYYEGDELFGDGTVPRLSSFPWWLDEDDPTIKWAANHHGALVHDEDVFDQLEGILTARPYGYRLAPPKPGEPAQRFDDWEAADFASNQDVRDSGFGLSVPPLVAPDEPLVVTFNGGVGTQLTLRVVDENGINRARRRFTPRAEDTQIVLPQLPPGGYLITAGPTKSQLLPRPVTTMAVVWDEGSAS